MCARVCWGWVWVRGVRGVMCEGLGSNLLSTTRVNEFRTSLWPEYNNSRARESRQTWSQGHFKHLFPDHRLLVLLHEDSQAFSSQFFFSYLRATNILVSMVSWSYCLAGGHPAWISPSISPAFFCVLLIFTLQTRASICFPRMALL